MKHLCFGAIASLLGLFIACEPVSKPQSAPNILLILVDDMGLGDLSLYGNPYLQTPNLDQLGRESVQFSHFYVSPVCAPTRASLLTGRYHHRVGVRSVTNGFENMIPTEQTIAELLQPLGYRTGIFGKWHVGEYYPSIPQAQGFDEFIGFRTGHTSDYYDAVLEKNGDSFPTKGYITNVLTQEAINFMQSTPENQPFFCYLPYNVPHTPLQIDTQSYEKFLSAGLTEKTARLYGMMENMDQHIGRLREFLASDPKYKNTILIFLSDNGPVSGWKLPQEKLRYNLGLRDQKFSVYEGGIRTACFWQWADHWQVNTVDEIGAHIDILPTLWDILQQNTPPEKPWDGHSLLPLLQGKTSPDPDREWFENYSLETLREPAPQPGGIMRQGQWKMAHGTELYDLDADPGETVNLSEQEPDRLAAMNQAYLRWWEDIYAEQEFAMTPIEIGHEEENPVFLQPHHARVVAGELQFLGQRGTYGERIGRHPNGVDGDWLGNWTRTGDACSWSVEVVEAGEYSVEILARGTSTNERPDVSFQSPTDSLLITLPTMRPESWQRIPLGKAYFSSGLQQLSLRLESSPSNGQLEIRSLVLTHPTHPLSKIKAP